MRNKFRFGNIWNSRSSYLIWHLSELGPSLKNCHARKNSTDRTNAGAERGRNANWRASRLASAKGAGATAPAQTPAGTDRSEERRVGKECRSRWATDD